MGVAALMSLPVGVAVVANGAAVLAAVAAAVVHVVVVVAAAAVVARSRGYNRNIYIIQKSVVLIVSKGDTFCP